MSTSYLTYEERGIWVNDLIILEATKIMIKLLDTENNWMMEYKTVLTNLIHNEPVGWSDLELDSFLLSQKRKEEFIALISKSIELSKKEITNSTIDQSLITEFFTQILSIIK